MTSSKSSPAAKPVNTEDFVAAMGQHVASVCVITTLHEGERYGLTATAVSSVCAAPPRLLVCINKSGVTHGKIVASGRFCVNVLAEAQAKVGKAFAGMLGRDFARFSLGEWQELATGSPAIKGATAVFDCRLVETLDQFTHSIFIGEVVAVESTAGQDALLYGERHFRALRKAAVPASDADMESLHF